MEKKFCCEGCAWVYRILHENRLDGYYQLDKTPGIRIEDEAFESNYAYLDQSEFSKLFIEFSDGGISRTTLFIPAIHCSSCIWLLENLRTLNKGVLQSSVNFVRKEVSITFRESNTSFRQLVELLCSIHYIPELTPKRETNEKQQRPNRKLLSKIGVAGFAFGNIMLLSFPDYLAKNELLDGQMTAVLSWIALVLAIPVLLYSASDYLLSAYKSLRKRVLTIDLPLSIGILALFLQSAFTIASRQGIGYMDSFAGLVFFLLIGKWYQSKSYQALAFDRDYKSYFPLVVTRCTLSGEEYIPISELSEGDRIRVRNNEFIPADAVLLEGVAHIDYSFVTGESIPVQKQSGDFVYAGGRQKGSSIVLEIQKKVQQSYLTQLWSTSAEPKPLQKLVNRMGRYFTFGILAVAFSAAGYWAIVDLSKAVPVFSSILIVACPCALALSVPFAFGNTLRLFGRNGFYLKNTDVIETLSKVDTVVFDKTGTLTYSQKMNLEWIGEPLSGEEKAVIYSLSRNSTHPLSVLVSSFLESPQTFPVEAYQETASKGLQGNINGIAIKLGAFHFVQNPAEKQSFPGSSVSVSFNHVFRGRFSIQNSYREGLSNVVRELFPRKLHLLSGDNDREYSHLVRIFPDPDHLHFNQLPLDKQNYVHNLKIKGHIVAMIGDGLNDAGALQEADVAISLADDIYHFSPACDAILEARQFGQLHKFLEFSKTSVRIVYLSFFISIVYNLIGLFFAVQGLLSPLFAAVLMPVSSVSVVAFATIAVRWGYAKLMGKRN